MSLDIESEVLRGNSGLPGPFACVTGNCSLIRSTMLRPCGQLKLTWWCGWWNINVFRGCFLWRSTFSCSATSSEKIVDLAVYNTSLRWRLIYESPNICRSTRSTLASCWNPTHGQMASNELADHKIFDHLRQTSREPGEIAKQLNWCFFHFLPLRQKLVESIGWKQWKHVKTLKSCLGHGAISSFAWLVVCGKCCSDCSGDSGVVFVALVSLWCRVGSCYKMVMFAHVCASCSF